MDKNSLLEDFVKSDESYLPDINVEVLSKRDDAFLVNFGIGGLLLSAVCFIQLLLLIRDPSLKAIGALVALLTQTTAYILLLRKSQWGGPILLIGTVLSFGVKIILILESFYSLALLLMVIYSIIAVSLIYAASIPQKLRMKANHERESREDWQDLYNKSR